MNARPSTLTPMLQTQTLSGLWSMVVGLGGEISASSFLPLVHCKTQARNPKPQVVETPNPEAGPLPKHKP